MNGPDPTIPPHRQAQQHGAHDSADLAEIPLHRQPAPWTWFVVLLAGIIAAGIASWKAELWPLVWLAWLATWVLAVTAIRRLSVDALVAADRYQQLSEDLGAVVWEGPGAAGPPDHVSDLVRKQFGFEPAECTEGAMPSGRVEPEDLGPLANARLQVSQGHDAEIGYRIRDGRGRLRHVTERIRVTLTPHGLAARRRGVVTDTTEQWVLEGRAARLAEFAEVMPFPAAVLRMEDLDRPNSLVVRFANAAAADQLHLWAGDHPLVQRGGPDDLLAHFPGLERQLLDVVRLRTTVETAFHEPDGALMSLRVVPLGDQSIGITAEKVLAISEDEESVREMGLHDPLTGLPSRSLFIDRAQSALARARRTDEPLAILMLDLDHFKEVNDTLGHERGDEVLVELARRFTTELRDCDTVARLGGDEFAILLTTDASVKGTRGVAERVARITEEAIGLGDIEVRVGASIGAARHPDHGADVTELLRRADSAMYRAKKSGATFAFFSQELEQIEIRHIELRSALMGDEWTDQLRIAYRPRLDLVSLQPIGIEAAGIWDHPRHGNVELNDLVEIGAPIARLSLLAQRVTEQAVADILSLGGAPGLTINVDLSLLPVLDGNLETWLPDLLHLAGVPAGSLCMQITQAQVTGQYGLDIGELQTLRQGGARFCLGGFGSLDSSLAALRDLPIDEILIHRQFVRELAEGNPDIVRTVIDLAHRLGLTAVADGVDTTQVLDRVRVLECDAALGAIAGGPMSKSELAVYLHQHAGDRWPSADV